MLRIITPAGSQELTSLAVVKSEFNITDSSEDATLTRYIRQASAAIARHTGQVWGRETVEQTDWWNGSNGCSPRGLLLRRALDVDLVSITENDTALDVDDFAVDGAVLYRIVGGETWRYYWGPKTVVTYASGYDLPDAIPADVEQAALLTIAAMRLGRNRDPMLRSESAEGIGSASYVANSDMDGLPSMACALLEPWRRVLGV